MRKQFCETMLSIADDPNLVFLTGDLGFMALEPIQRKMKDRFINVGISEQNMVSVAAAMSSEGLNVWVYSIAPFCYARPFEQIRNDICFHNLPVKLVGNGAGYGYGVMGPTHHAIEDYGVMLTLPNMVVFAPVFNEDLSRVVDKISKITNPVYLRLGVGNSPNNFIVPKYAQWRQLIHGDGMVVIAVGSLACEYIEACSKLPNSVRPNLWALSELPFSTNTFPRELINQITSGPGVCVAEEHVARGGAGSELASYLMANNIHPKRFLHLYALKHNYDRYGSQSYLRKCSGLDSNSLLSAIRAF